MGARVGAVLLAVAAGCAASPSPMEPGREPPAAARALVSRGAVIEVSGDARKALAIYRRAWEQGARDSELPYRIGYLAARTGQVAEAWRWLDRAAAAGFDDPELADGDEDLVVLRRDRRYTALRARLVSNAARTRARIGVDLPRATPAAAGIDPRALAALLERAAATHSGALVLLRDGKLVGEWYFGRRSRRFEAMSASKSIVGLAIGLLIDGGELRSIDQPVREFFPEWSQGKKRGITIRQLLSHTSGLQTEATTEGEIGPSPDLVRLALAAELDDPPGTRFTYNNKAVNLLPAIVEVVSGQRMDRFLAARLFGPLGITEVDWKLDDAGHPFGMSGLQIHPLDLAKIGQLMLERGLWRGRSVLSADWIARSIEPSQSFLPTCGLLWWRKPQREVMVFTREVFDRLAAGGLARPALEKLADLEGRELSKDALIREVTKRLGEDGFIDFLERNNRSNTGLRRDVPPYDGFAAEGDLGQYLLVMPSRRLVAVRMTDAYDMPSDELYFSDFVTLVRALVPPGG